MLKYMQQVLRGPRQAGEVGFSVQSHSRCGTGHTMQKGTATPPLMAAYLYLLGLLLAERHSDLQLGLFINIQCRGWLRSSR